MYGFMIRKSAIQNGAYYIDFAGEYEVSAISKKTRITESVIEHIYKENKGTYDTQRHVFYFPEYGNADDAMKALSVHIKGAHLSRVVELTEEEIEYIRKALINEDSNVIYTNSRIRDGIFNKLNR